MRAASTSPTQPGPWTPPRPHATQSLLKRASRSGSAPSQPRDRGSLNKPGSGGSSGAAAHRPWGALGGTADALRQERAGPKGAVGEAGQERIPAGRLAPVAAQQQQHGQQHERGARPVETGVAVTVVQEAAPPQLLRGQEGPGGRREPRFSDPADRIWPPSPQPPHPAPEAAFVFSLWSRLGSSPLGSYTKRGQDITLKGTPSSF